MIRLGQKMVLGSHEEITWPYQPGFFTVNYALLPKHALGKHSSISALEPCPSFLANQFSIYAIQVHQGLLYTAEKSSIQISAHISVGSATGVRIK